MTQSVFTSRSTIRVRQAYLSARRIPIPVEAQYKLMTVPHNAIAGQREPFGLLCFHEANRNSDDGVIELLKVLLCPTDLN